MKAAARRRLFEAQMWSAFKVGQSRQREAVIAWDVRRRLLTAELLGKPLQRVEEWDVSECRWKYGVPNEPRPEFRMDRRYGPRLPKPVNPRKPTAPETVKR